MKLLAIKDVQFISFTFIFPYLDLGSHWVVRSATNRGLHTNRVSRKYLKITNQIYFERTIICGLLSAMNEYYNQL